MTTEKMTNAEIAKMVQSGIELIECDIRQLESPHENKLGDWTFTQPTRNQTMDSLRGKVEHLLLKIKDQI